MFSIGKIRLDGYRILAPLAGISDLPFRLINREFGCEFAFTEMISARSLVYGSKKTLRMLATSTEDRPLGVQLLGADPEILKKAVELLGTDHFDVIDLNAACPVAKVTARGEGSALLKSPEKLHSLLKVLVSCSAAPVTVKIRTGWDHNSVNARDIALYAEDAGISGIIVHGRTKIQGYSGRVDYDSIRQVREAVTVPVIASGDVLSPKLIEKMFEETGCHGVTVARGALGNPWIFSATDAYLKTGVLTPRPAMDEIAETMLRHLDLCTVFRGEKLGIMIFRKFFAWYTRGISDMKPLRERAFRAVSRYEMEPIINMVRESTDRLGCAVTSDPF